MDLTFRSIASGVFERLSTGRPPLSFNPERRRRIRAAIACSLAALIGLLSFSSIEQSAIERHRRLQVPTPDQVRDLVGLAGFKPTPSELLAHLPPFEPAGTWWKENPTERIWFVDASGAPMAFDRSDSGSMHAAKTPARFEVIGGGWEAMPQVLETLKPRSQRGRTKKESSKPQRLHPREWAF
ncbi:MAG: hypothetical protein ACK5QT_07855 [Oligoflexia bacterium]